MINEEDRRSEVYYIPGNYEDAGGALGGRVKTRNLIELIVLCGPIVAILCNVPLGWEAKMIIGTITVLPIGAFSILGIGGESLSQIALAFLKYHKSKRKLHYCRFTKTTEVKHKDSLIDLIFQHGFKKGMAISKEQKNATPEESQINQTEEEQGNVSPFEKIKNFKAFKKAKEEPNAFLQSMQVREVMESDETVEERTQQEVYWGAMEEPDWDAIATQEMPAPVPSQPIPIPVQQPIRGPIETTMSGPAPTTFTPVYQPPQQPVQPQYTAPVPQQQPRISIPPTAPQWGNTSAQTTQTQPLDSGNDQPHGYAVQPSIDIPLAQRKRGWGNQHQNDDEVEKQRRVEAYVQASSAKVRKGPRNRFVGSAMKQSILEKFELLGDD